MAGNITTMTATSIVLITSAIAAIPPPPRMSKDRPEAAKIASKRLNAIAIIRKMSDNLRATLPKLICGTLIPY